MKNMNSQTIVNLQSGQACGQLRDGVLRFLGLPYGERENAQSRLSNVKPPAAWSGIRDATTPGPVFPQLRSRLALVMGDAIDANAQSEDAFIVNVWAPENAQNLPVFFFIHGGGFLSGGGSAAWYDGERIAREEKIVVVTVNYRLGALGHYTPDGLPANANRATRDLIQALHWVRDNITEFGGDPSQVTVGGQSAGAWYAWLLGLSPASRGLLQRNILLSLPHMPPMSEELTRSHCQLFKEQCAGKSLDELSIQELLEAQLKMLRALAAFGEVSVGFRPAVEEGLVPEYFLDFAQAAQHAHVTETLLGATNEENAAFMFQAPDALAASEQHVHEWYARQFGAQAQEQYALHAARRPQHTPYTQLVDASSDQLFANAVSQIAKACAAQKHTATAYRFNVQTQVPHLMSPHCMELPFLFGNRADWADAPMLANISDEVFERVGADLRQAVGSFVRHGAARASGTSWPVYSQGQPKITEITESGAIA